MSRTTKSTTTRGTGKPAVLMVECPDDGYIVRTTQKWLDIGTPTCPCGTEMVPETPKEDV